MTKDSRSTTLDQMLIGVPLAARILGVSERTVYRMIEDGQIRAVKVRGALRINHNALLAKFGLGEATNA